MKSRQFPSFEDAVRYCEERGSLKYFGREGSNFEYCVYTLTIGNRVYHLFIYANGKLVVTDQTWKVY